jgi:hypothetical protein
VESGPPGERVIILRGQSREEVRERLANGYAWFERTGRDLVEELHESRRRARKREAPAGLDAGLSRSTLASRCSPTAAALVSARERSLATAGPHLTA